MVRSTLPGNQEPNGSSNRTGADDNCPPVTVTQIALVAIPLAIVEITLLLLAAVDLLSPERRVRGGSKAVWAIVIVFVNVIGPLLYFFVGRDEGAGVEPQMPPPPSPGANADLLRSWTPLVDKAPAAIETSGLTKSFGRVLALDGLNMSVPSGSIFGFLGPNGAGKTTTLRLLAGLARPSAGSATVAGVSIGSNDAQLATRIAYLDQDPRFYNWMTGRELLELVGRLYGLRGYELSRRVGEVLEIIGLGSAADRKVGGYSGGMRQRLGIGQALVNRPQVLFLDEPVSSLDPEGRRDLLEVIAALRGRATVFMCTHILNDVERVCDQVAIVNLGHLVVEGPIDELLDRYAQPVYEMEPEPGQPDAVARITGQIKPLPWVRDVVSTSDTVRVFVDDPRQASAALLPAVAQTGVALMRFERARPSLEDVFMRLLTEPSGVRVAPDIEIPVTGLDGRGRR
jgi:ABC-2 type transport system ATP-binding protein